MKKVKGKNNQRKLKEESNKAIEKLSDENKQKPTIMRDFLLNNIENEI